MMSDKKLSQIEKLLGPDTCSELQQNQDLKSEITKAAESMKRAEEELEANPTYQQLKESLKDVSAGLRDVKKRQNAIIQYCLHLREETRGNE